VNGNLASFIRIDGALARACLDSPPLPSALSPSYLPSPHQRLLPRLVHLHLIRDLFPHGSCCLPFFSATFALVQCGAFSVFPSRVWWVNHLRPACSFAPRPTFRQVLPLLCPISRGHDVKEARKLGLYFPLEVVLFLCARLRCCRGARCRCDSGRLVVMPRP